MIGDTNIDTLDICPMASVEYCLLLNPFSCEMALLFYSLFIAPAVLF